MILVNSPNGRVGDTARSREEEFGKGARAPAEGARFIDPRVLTSIGNLDLLARIVVDGFVSGLHRAVFRGVSTEFAEHRPYAPGDDIRQLDWRLYARTDRLSVKTYEAETNADLILALDVSRSMDFAGQGINKLNYGRMLLASLAHLAGRQRDRVGLATFDRSLVSYVPPSVRHRDRVLHTLESVVPGPGGELAGCLEALAGALVRRGIVVVVSDFYLPPEEAVRALETLHVRGHDVIAIHLLDPAERELDVGATTMVEDMETGEQLPISTGALRDEYQVLVRKHLDGLSRGCGEHQVDYACFDTAMPLDHLLFRYLSQRAKWARVR